METTQMPQYETLGAAIRAVVADGRACRDDQRYQPVFFFWHLPNKVEQNNEVPICQICTAGAYMAQTLRTLPTTDANPDFFNGPIGRFLRAVDLLREGMVGVALRNLHAVVRGRPTSEKMYRLTDVAHDQFARRLKQVGTYRDRSVFNLHLNILDELADWLDQNGF